MPIVSSETRKMCCVVPVARAPSVISIRQSHYKSDEDLLIASCGNRFVIANSTLSTDLRMRLHRTCCGRSGPLVGSSVRACEVGWSPTLAKEKGPSADGPFGKFDRRSLRKRMGVFGPPSHG